MTLKKSKLRLIRITSKNFRSIDNRGATLNYSDSGTTMIGSLDNGAGKSTNLIFSLFYAFFDKSYAKGGKKTSLINSRSNKDCVVEVEFEVNGDHYVVRRGQKPTLFEIIKNKVKIEDEAALKDYQTNLYKIIGMDERVFCNTIALGKDKFVPFVDMSLGDRRAYGEQMLDVTVFSQMNLVNKSEQKEAVTLQLKLNSELNSNEINVKRVEQIIQVKKAAAESQIEDLNTRYVDELTKANAEAVKISNNEIPLKQENNSLAAHLKNRDDLLSKETQRTAMSDAIKRVEATISQKKQELQRKIDHKVCGSCGQDIPMSMKEVHIELDKNAIAQSEKTLEEAKLKYSSLINSSDDLAKLNASINSLQQNINLINSQIQSSRAVMSVHINNAKQISAKVEEVKNASVDWNAELEELNLLNIESAKKKSDLEEVTRRLIHHKVIEAALKDDGAKSKIIAQYIPFINERINFYLEKMNLFVQIQLDNEFELEMLAPDRKGQSISDLSSGQKMRIDISTLLAWRDVARLSASCDCNILALDEILEVLSEIGVSDFIDMWRSLEGSETTALYVITQRVSEFEQFFDKSIIYKLVDGSTEVHSES